MDSEFSFWLFCCLAVVLLFYCLFELHYFLRMCLCVALARFVKRKCHILETTTVSGTYYCHLFFDYCLFPFQNDHTIIVLMQI